MGKEFYAQFVAYEHTFGDNATGIDQVEEGTMTWKALQKAFGSFMREKDYDKVLHEDPEFVQEHGLTGYPGAVYGDIRPYATDIYVPGVVTSYNGVWWRHDKLYARAAFAGLEANLTPEIAL